jgi:SAM-dependent methyltransferase
MSTGLPKIGIAAIKLKIYFLMPRKVTNKLSKRLADCINALPLIEGMRVLEIGCGPGAAAREISRRIGKGYILGIDRSAKAIQQVIACSQEEIKTGKISFKQVAIADFELDTDESLFDMAIAFRVGALDGRHPEIEKQSLVQIAKALMKNGKLFTDGGDPLKEISLDGYRMGNPWEK